MSTPDLPRVRKILVKDKGAMEKPSKILREDLSRTLEKVLGILQDTHYSDTIIKRRTKMWTNIED